MGVTTQDQLSADLAMGTVMLKVGDMKKMSGYYQKALGLEVLSEGPAGTGLGRRGLELVHLSDGKGLDLPARGEAGLFHTALLFDTQSDLAATVLSAAQFDGSLFTGSSDHLVSEAFYFNDPEGNGIELYLDRPRDTWTWNGDTVAMDTIYLDPNDFLNTHLNEAPSAGCRRRTPASATSTCRSATSPPPRSSTSTPSASPRPPASTARRSSSPPAATTTTWP